MKFRPKFTKVIAAVLTLSLASFGALSLTGCEKSSTNPPQLKQPTVSYPTIGVDGKLRVGVNSNNSPLAGKSGGKLVGIDVDIAAALADELGLALETVDVGADSAKAIKDKKVDIVMGVESGSKEQDCWLTTQYMPTAIVLFQDEKSTYEIPKATDNPKIAAQVSSKSAWAITNIFGDDSLTTATDLSAAFKSIGTRDAMFVASDALVGMYAANRDGVDASICALLESPTGYCAMGSAENEELQKAVSDALSTLVDNGTVEIIEQKWLSEPVDLSSVSKIEGLKSATDAKVSADANVAVDPNNPNAQGQNGANASAGASASETGVNASVSTPGASSGAASSSSSTSSSSKTNAAR